MINTNNRKALITGITGQDGSYLAELLLDKGYEVHGIVRRSSSFNTGRIEHLYVDPHSPGARLFLHYGDLVDGTGLREILTRVQPDEVYNLGAQSHVRVSFDQPVYTVQTDALGTINLLEAIRDTGLPIRFYQASSSEMYGKVVETPQTETTPFYPRSPYACARSTASGRPSTTARRTACIACNGILFNHESPRRGETFVTRKITRAATRIKEGLAGQAVPGQPRRQARLGLCRRLRRGDVADAPAGQGRRLRHRHRRDPQRPRVPRRGVRPARARLEEVRRDRPALLPPRRGGPAAGRPGQGQDAARLEAEGRPSRSWRR